MIFLYKLVENTILKILFTLLIGGLASDSFCIRTVSELYLDTLTQIIDAPSYLIPGLTSKDLEQKVRCKRVFEKQTRELLQAMDNPILISRVTKKNIPYWNDYIRKAWHYTIAGQAAQDYNGRIELNKERGEAFLKILIDEGIGRRDLCKFYKAVTE